MEKCGIEPENILAEQEDYLIINGVKARKGTIAAVLQNAGILSSKNATQEEKQAAKTSIVNLSPALIALGMHEHVIWKNPEIQRIIEESLKHQK